MTELDYELATKIGNQLTLAGIPLKARLNILRIYRKGLYGE